MSLPMPAFFLLEILLFSAIFFLGGAPQNRSDQTDSATNLKT